MSKRTHTLMVEIPLRLDGMWDYSPTEDAIKAAVSISRAAADGAICDDIVVHLREDLDV